MNLFNRQGRGWTLLLAALAALWLAGCSKKAGQEPPPDTSSASANNAPDTLTDNRDGKKYKTITIGNNTWMAENLAYKMEGSGCYEDKPENCAKYGMAYNWKAALKACPSGWHLPTEDESINVSNANVGNIIYQWWTATQTEEYGILWREEWGRCIGDYRAQCFTKIVRLCVFAGISPFAAIYAFSIFSAACWQWKQIISTGAG